MFELFKIPRSFDKMEGGVDCKLALWFSGNGWVSSEKFENAGCRYWWNEHMWSSGCKGEEHASGRAGTRGGSVGWTAATARHGVALTE